MDIVTNIALVSINETLFIQLISFLIFLYLIKRIMFRPLTETMELRENHLDTMEQDILNAETELERVKSMLKHRENDARASANLLRKELEEEGSHESARIFKSVHDEILNLREDARIDIERQIAEARKHVKKESKILAKAIMEKVLERRLSI